MRFSSIQPLLQSKGKYFLLFSLLLIISVSLSAQESNTGKLTIRSGIMAAMGNSQLLLSDEVRYPLTTSEYYTFHPNIFIKFGAMITVQPPSFSDRIQLIFDPSFGKYSYGSNGEQITDTVANFIDLDVEELEFPLSVRYSFTASGNRVQPYIRARYAFGYFIDTYATFKYKQLEGDGNWVEYSSDEFDFAKFQNHFSAALGIEFNFEWVDYTLELVMDIGDGIHSRKGGSDFMKISRTSSYCLQFGVLF